MKDRELIINRPGESGIQYLKCEKMERMEGPGVVVMGLDPEHNKVKWFYGGKLQVEAECPWNLYEKNIKAYAGVEGAGGIVELI